MAGSLLVSEKFGVIGGEGSNSLGIINFRE